MSITNEELAQVKLPQFPVLSVERWINARNQSIKDVASSIPVPSEENYVVKGASVYPKWLTVSLLVVLIMVLIFSFGFSGTKQIAATGLIVDDLSTTYNHLSHGWTDLVITFALGLGELGSLLFSASSGIFGGESREIEVFGKTMSIRPVAWIFRFFAVACALAALFANVAVTALNPVAGVAGYQWFMTFLAPLVVLGIGLFLERLLVETLAQRGEQKARYAAALTEYNNFVSAPDTFPGFNAIWGQNIYAEMCRYKKDKDIILPLVQARREFMPLLVQMEWQAQQVWEAFDVSVIENPTQPSSEGRSQAALPSQAQSKLGFSEMNSVSIRSE